MTASILTSSEMAAAAISMSSASSSKTHQCSLPSGRRFDLQEVVTSLKLGSGEGYSGAAADPMSGDLPDVVGDVL